MTFKSLRLPLLFVSTLSINSAFALPIDWTGVFGVDTHMISNFCRTNDDIDVTAGSRTGTQAIDTTDCDTTFQTYTLKLNPNIIVNDGVTLKGELSTGYIRGDFAGSDSTNTANGTSANNSYFFTTPAQRSELNVNQMYMEIYADTALVKIGRMSKHYGMGIIFDGGNDPWDRFLTMYDGIEAEMKIGNFSVIPYYAKISSYDGNATDDGRSASGAYDVRELGMVAKYDNKNRDLVASVLYAKRSSERRNTFYNSENQTAGVFDRGSTEVTVIEPYVSKRWSKLRVSAEASIQSGDYGEIYAQGEESKISAQAYVLNAVYDLNPKWDLGLLVGQASGDDGDSSKFEAAYLHPNFQIADLMFRYNYTSFNQGGRSIFDSSVTNARFVKLSTNYKTDKWTWKGAFIFANALETAESGKRGYHHEDSYAFTNSSEDQQDDYGYEVDFGFDYRWNPNVTITGYYGYWIVGDYYAYDNNPNEKISLENVHGGGLRATLEF